MADIVLMLNRPYDVYGITGKYEGYDTRGLLACHVVKNRGGELGMVPFDADMKHFTIWERPETIELVTAEKKSKRKLKVTVEENGDEETW